MAQTWRAHFTGVPITGTAPTNMACINNATGSGVVIRVTQVYIMLPGGIGTSAMGLFSLARCGNATSNTSTIINPVPLSSSNTALPSQVVCGSRFTATASDVFRRIAVDVRRPVVNAISVANPAVGADMQASMHSFSLYNGNTKSTNLEPITVRENQSLCVFNLSLSNTAPAMNGVMDIVMEFYV